MFWSAPRTAGLPAMDLGFTQDDIKGFRAPQLGISPGLYKTLAKKGLALGTNSGRAPTS